MRKGKFQVPRCHASSQHLNRNKAEETKYTCIKRNRPANKKKTASHFNMVAQIITSHTNYTAQENKNEITIPAK